MKISARLLKSKGACQDQVDLFKSIFGTKATEVTEELCIAHAPSFDWGWAARNLLSAPALAEYGRVVDTASAEYQRIRAAASAEYERVVALAFGRIRA